MSATTMVEMDPRTRPSRALSFESDTSIIAKRKPSYMIKLSLDEDGRVVVSSNLQGVATDGADEQEAIRNAQEAIEGILEARNMDKEYNIIVVHTRSV